MNPAPQILSNEIEEFQAGGGLYPGGTCLIEECCYKLWDYNGKRPKDSQTAAYLRLKPLDGSNEGKIVEQFYSVGGTSSDYVPDNTGGNLISLKGSPLRDSTNWAHFLETLRNNCGLEKGRLSTNLGIRALQNGVITVVKADQKHRDFGDDLPATGGKDDKKKFKATTLLPTKFTATWDPNYANATRNIPMASVHAQAPAPAPAPTSQYTNGAPPAPAMAPPPMPTGGPVDATLSGVLKSLLAKHNGSLTTTGLPKLVLEELGASVTREVRVAVAKEAGDMALVAAAAQVNGWVLAGTDLIG
jgi:hypothetical protein